MSSVPAESEVLGYFERLSNRGRWGADDEAGTLNLITPAKRLQAAALVRHGLAVSCGALIRKGQGAPDVPYPPLHFMIRSGESADHARPGMVDYLGLVFHGLTTTHLDALGHTARNGELYGGRPRTVITTELGATQLSVDALRDGIVTRGVLLDMAGLAGRPYLEPGEAITPADLERAEERAGVRLEPGDALLVRTGWWHHRAAHGPAEGRSRPGLHAACLPWLHERGISVLATDAANDVVPSGYDALEQPVHEVGQVAMGLCLLDACDFDALLEACERADRREFLFVVAPLRIEYGTGSPVNPLAVL
jgi:kynurenine formamidase